MVERRTENPQVGGSIPPLPSTRGHSLVRRAYESIETYRLGYQGRENLCTRIRPGAFLYAPGFSFPCHSPRGGVGVYNDGPFVVFTFYPSKIKLNFLPNSTDPDMYITQGKDLQRWQGNFGKEFIATILLRTRLQNGVLVKDLLTDPSVSVLWCSSTFLQKMFAHLESDLPEVPLSSECPHGEK